MATHNYISKSQIKTCNTCGSMIVFVKNKKNKWFSAEVISDQGGRAYYESGIGAYGNLTPWHTCRTPQVAVTETVKAEWEDDYKNPYTPEQMIMIEQASDLDAQGKIKEALEIWTSISEQMKKKETV